jgi:hypothetical protein
MLQQAEKHAGKAGGWQYQRLACMQVSSGIEAESLRGSRVLLKVQQARKRAGAACAGSLLLLLMNISDTHATRCASAWYLVLLNLPLLTTCLLLCCCGLCA